MDRYLVTGGCGFIGSNLTQSLINDGHEVIVLDDLSSGKAENISPKVHLIKADVSNFDEVAKVFSLGLSGCFHLAANPSVSQSINEYGKCHKTNLGGLITVLEVAAKVSVGGRTKIPVIFASSCAVYGNSNSLPLSESLQLKPLSFYGADKLSGEIHATLGSNLLDVPSLGLRFFNVYGPGQRASSDYSGVLSIFCSQLLLGNPIRIYGDGQQVRDFVFVSDVVDVMKLAMKNVRKLSPGIFNVCSGEGTTITEVAEIVAELCGGQFKVIYESEREGDIRVSIGDPALCKKILGWQTTTNMREGLKQVIDWLRQKVY